MKKFLMMASVFAFTAILSQSVMLSPAFAQDDNGGPPAAHGPRGDGNGPGGPGGGPGGGQGPNLDEIKSKIIQRMDEHIAKMQKAEACVKAASDREALRACMPKRKHGGGDRDGDGRGWKRGGGDNGGGFMRHRRGGGSDNGGGPGGDMPDDQGGDE